MSQDATIPGIATCRDHAILSAVKTITALITDFDHLTRGNDAEIVSRFVYYARTAKKLVPKSVVSASTTVIRTPESLGIDLLDSKGKFVARFYFVPTPPFRSPYA